MRPQDLDDEAPPRADGGLLARVRSRGRSLQQRRRARRGASLALLVVALTAGIIVITRHDDRHPTVSVDPTTTTRPPSTPMVYERIGDAGGVHYMLLLHTPVVAVGARVSVELVVENRTDHVVNAGCTNLDVTVFGSGHDRPAPTMPMCLGRNSLARGGILQNEGNTTAPYATGRYLIAVATNSSVPASLLEPMDLQVVAPPPAAGAGPRCSSEVSVGAHPRLSAPAGLAPTPGLSMISSDAGGLATPKRTAPSHPAPDCTYTAVGGIGQVWVSNAALEQYGTADKVPLPIPFRLASKHPGPVEVTLDVLTLQDRPSATALLSNPTYASNPGWTRLPDVSIGGGFVNKVYSAANDGLDEFVVQRVVGTSWIEVAVLGAQLNPADAVRIAEAVTLTP
ncbi:MAG: hypothetical protein QOE62_839 [Actinomycetota bacterium]|nr:hypothetical protein [Actinomycetota bacterium]